MNKKHTLKKSYDTKEEMLDDVRSFILANGDKMTNIEMSKALGYKVYGVVAGMKKSGQLQHGWLKTDKIKAEQRKIVVDRKLKTVSNFRNVRTCCKQSARELIIRQVLKLKGKVLSLCGETIETERLIHARKPQSYIFDVCEYLPKVYTKIIKRAVELNILPRMNFYHGAIGDLIKKANKGEYSHMILDYCGTLERFQEDIRMSMERMLVKVGGSISITLCKRNRLTPFMQKWADYDPTTKTGSINMDAIMNFLNAHRRDIYKIKTVHEYKQLDTKGEKRLGSNMVLIILERVK